MSDDVDNEKLTWAVRNVDYNTMRRMVEELLHFDEPSGSFQIVSLMSGERFPKNVRDDTRSRYDVLLSDYSCSYLQEAWEGWDPTEKING